MSQSSPITDTEVSNAIAISVRGVRKLYGDFVALENISLDIADNEFFTLLGPSGCGKTTLLRTIAGFESSDAGEIKLYGDEIESLPPNKRPVNTVFQSYALFPHMNVAENIGFGLKMLGWSDADCKQRVNDMIATVKLEEFAHRKPSQLSGGQQQRVALARAIAPKPKVLLLDEPLSALDLKLRQQMRAELKSLQRETGITFVFVTHDQEEALTMSDRIAVMSNGSIQQIGAPSDVYEQPANRFVADFIGETNLFPVTIAEVQQGELLCELQGGQTIRVSGSALAPYSSIPAVNDQWFASIRPEKLQFEFTEPGEQENSNSVSANSLRGARLGLTGVVDSVTYLGTDLSVGVRLSDSLQLNVRQQNTGKSSMPISIGSSVAVYADESAVRIFES